MNAVESLLIAAVMRGLAVDDLEATSAQAPGRDRRRYQNRRCRGCAKCSRTQFESWSARCLDVMELNYPSLDVVRGAVPVGLPPHNRPGVDPTWLV
jgi:hypothetical protein